MRKPRPFSDRRSPAAARRTAPSFKPRGARRRGLASWVLAGGTFVVFAAAIGAEYSEFLTPGVLAVPEAAMLPAAAANPAELAFADTLRRGETLSELLGRSHLDQADAAALLSELAAHQDPRHLQPGSIVAYRRAFFGGALRGMAFRLDSDRTLNLRRADAGWSGAVEEVEVRADTAVLTGTVSLSLYAALLSGDAQGVPAEERERVADILAERIFAWQVDFSRDLRKGDEFRILYERLVRPDGTARSGRVLAVQFEIAGRDHQAYLFSASNGSEDYYDAEGESLRRAFLRAPLEFRRISSAFSTSRFHPILKRSRPHHGIDYSASRGTPVRSVGDGVVRRAGNGGGYGNLVEIRHKRGYASRYAHLQRFAKGVRSGTTVKQGQIIGYVGSSGLATGPHLHYEFHSNGRPVNPSSIKYITGDPVPSASHARFAGQVALQRAALSGGDVQLAGHTPANRVAAEQ